MLNLAATTDKFQLVTSAAGDVHVHTSYIDLSGTTVTPGRANNSISTATTTDIVAAPGASTYRNLKALLVRNRHATISQDITVLFNQNGTQYELLKTTLRPNETLQWTENFGFFTVAGPSAPLRVTATADQVVNAADNYLNGSAITLPAGRPMQIGTVFIWKMSITKTGAGAATPTWNIRVGGSGNISDTARITLVGVAQTGAADTAAVEILATVRGPLTGAGIMTASLDLHHNTSATGFANVPHSVITGASAGFDVTANPVTVGLSVNPGTAGVWTFTQVTGEVQNL